MQNCKKTIEILTSGEKLSMPQKLMLQMHLLLCKNCKYFSKHMKVMKECYSKLFQSKTELSKEQLAEAESTILEKLNFRK